MEIRTIFEDNIYEYTDHVDEDVAENMGCMCYRGIAGPDPYLLKPEHSDIITMDDGVFLMDEMLERYV